MIKTYDAVLVDMLSDWQADGIRLTKCIYALESRIAELESERRWRDSEVELPTEDTDGNALLVIHRHSGEWARAAFGIEFSDEFVRHYSHWMYAPELPVSEEARE